MAQRKLFTWTFWADAIERAVKTAVQSILVAGTLSNTGFINLFELDLQVVGQAALSGAIFSIFTSVVSAPIGESGTASVLPSPPMPPAPPDDGPDV